MGFHQQAVLMGFHIGTTIFPIVEPPFSLYPLIICYIAIENGSFTVDLHIKDGDLPISRLIIDNYYYPYINHRLTIY